MATEAQMRANAANAQHSTGPRTEEGKEASAQNALRHGMRAASILLPEEDPALLAELHAELLRDLRPVGSMQNLLFDRMVAAAWRLRRAHLIERGILERTAERYDPGDHAKTFTQQLRRKFQTACQSADALGKLSRYESTIERSLHRTMAELRRVQDATDTREAAPAGTIAPNEPNFAASDNAAGSSGADRGVFRRVSRCRS
jgi:hypothetical protein